MLDTVKIKHFLSHPPDFEVLRRNGWQPLYNTWDGNVRAVINNVQDHNGSPRMTIRQTPDGLWHFSIEASLPKVVRSFNVPLPDEYDVAEGLQMLAALAERKSGVTFKAETALVALAHFSRDVRLGEGAVIPQIAEIGRIELPRYERTMHNDTGVTFETKAKGKSSKRITIYCKLNEVLRRNGTAAEIEAARGLVRVEIALTTPSITYLVKKLGLPGRQTKHVLTRSFSDYVLAGVLAKLGLADAAPLADNTSQSLAATIGYRKAKNSLGFMRIREQHGEEFYRNPEIGCSRATYFRDLREARKAGLLP